MGLGIHMTAPRAARPPQANGAWWIKGKGWGLRFQRLEWAMLQVAEEDETRLAGQCLLGNPETVGPGIQLTAPCVPLPHTEGPGLRQCPEVPFPD